MKATIETRRDECHHGEFWTTYVVLDRYGRWRGDYSTWEAANARAAWLETLAAAHRANPVPRRGE